MLSLRKWRQRSSLAAAPLLALVLAIAGCTTGMGAAVESARQLMASKDSTQAVRLDPQFEYLRITRGGHVGLLWRGSTEQTPAGAVEVYYSGSGEVVRILNGRIVGALGLTTEWRQVAVTAPPWAAVLATPRAASYERVRDVMPGYRTGVRDELVLRPIAPPGKSALHGVDPATLTWFEETDRARGSFLFSSPALPPARYAVGSTGPEPGVVYAEQCLASDLCFTWQRWSLALQQAAASRN